MPPRSLLAPESSVPREDLFLNGHQHDEDESHGSKLRQNPSSNAKPARDFCNTKKKSEALTQPDLFRARLRILDMGVATADKHQSDHQPEKQNAQIGKSRKL